MSSREIAELTGKEHFNVYRDIRHMLDELEIGALSFEGSYNSAQGKKLPLFNLPKRETMILVSGYSLALRARIVDRWQELEAQVVQTPPPMLTPAHSRPVAAGHDAQWPRSSGSPRGATRHGSLRPSCTGPAR